MAVEIYVSSEELKKTLEYVALIGGNMASGKKQDDCLLYTSPSPRDA